MESNNVESFSEKVSLEDQTFPAAACALEINHYSEILKESVKKGYLDIARDISTILSERITDLQKYLDKLIFNCEDN